MNITNANKELKAKKLPTAFRPNNGPHGVYAVNVFIADMYGVIAVMKRHGFGRTETFDSISADFMVCFK